MVEDLGRRTDELWGVEGDAADTEGGTARVAYAPQSDNLGGAGGFSAGVKHAYELGAQWFWVMDDDVMVVPEAIERLEPWTHTHRVVQGSRYDYDGGPFYWQYHFIVPLGIPNPIAPAAFDESGFRAMNTMCFEGGLFARSVVDEIGFPIRASSSTGTTRSTATWPPRSPSRSSCPTSSCSAAAISPIGTSPASASSTEHRT